jgi:hypothetical protein
MGLRATVLAAAAVIGCAAEGEGLVIRIEDPAGIAPGTITHLELFVGRTGPDERFVRDFDPARDLYTVSLESLDGYRLFLRADVVPTDLEAVAIVGYTADPASGAAPVVMALVLDPPFMPGELLEVPVQLEAVVERANAGSGVRWAQRWTTPPIEVVADHSCLAWGTGGIVAGEPEGEVVRADDLDCDGTVPPTCDPEQRDPYLLEGEADLDGDGYAEWTDALCSGACLVGGAPVRCDCDESDDQRHFGRREICDGVDNDCDPTTHGDFAGLTSLPCQVAAGGECNMGIRTCTESNGLVETPCTALPASGVSCLDLDGCERPDACPVGFPAPGATLQSWHCVQNRSVAGAACGTMPVEQLFAQIPIPEPARCSAVLWGGDEPGAGWHFKLNDRATMVAGSVVTDVSCETLEIVAEGLPTSATAETVVILVIGDGAGTPLAVLPLHYRVVVGDGCDVQAVTLCTRS